MPNGPTFGRAVFGTRGKHVIAASHQPHLRQGDGGLGHVNVQLGLVSSQARFTAERRIKRHHGWALAFGRIFQAVRQQANARFAQVTHAFGYAGQKRQQGALDGVGANVGHIKAAIELFGQCTPRFELQAAVLKREFNDLSHLGHGAVNRRHPGQGPHREPLAPRRQPTQQRLGHHRIAYPLRRDDQRLNGLRNAHPL